MLHMMRKTLKRINSTGILNAPNLCYMIQGEILGPNSTSTQSLRLLLLHSQVYLMTPVLNLIFKNLQNINLLLFLFLCMYLYLFYI